MSISINPKQNVLWLSLLATTAYSQTAFGVITSVITDPEGGGFPGAFVQLRHTQTSAASNGVSATGGKYTLSQVAPGAYVLSVNVPGMKAYNRARIVVQTGQTLQVDVRLEDGPSLRTLGEDPAALAAIFFNRPPPAEGPVPRAPDGRPDLAGMWPGGPAPLGDLPMLPWAESLTKARTESHSKDHPLARCLPAGPVPLVAPGFFRIVQTPDRLLMLFENDNPGYRQVFLDGRSHPKNFGPTWNGHSTGKWEEETLIIDSIGFQDRGWLDFQGHPHTETMRVTQRLRRLDLGHMEIQIIIEDAGAYRQSWMVSKVATLAPDEEIQEYICNENNRDAAHMVGK